MATRRQAPGMHIFDTAFGAVGIGWTGRGVDRLELPRDTAEQTRERLSERCPGRMIQDRLPTAIRQAVARITRHLDGRLDPLGDLELDLDACSPFASRVYRALRQVAPGDVVSYGELAARIGRPGASRAVGRANGANPIPLIVPCHRVIRTDRSIGGFSAAGGVGLKARLLLNEGIVLDGR